MPFLRDEVWDGVVRDVKRFILMYACVILTVLSVKAAIFLGPKIIQAIPTMMMFSGYAIVLGFWAILAVIAAHLIIDSISRSIFVIFIRSAFVSFGPTLVSPTSSALRYGGTWVRTNATSVLLFPFALVMGFICSAHNAIEWRLGIWVDHWNAKPLLRLSLQAELDALLERHATLCYEVRRRSRGVANSYYCLNLLNKRRRGVTRALEVFGASAPETTVAGSYVYPMGSVTPEVRPSELVGSYVGFLELPGTWVRLIFRIDYAVWNLQKHLSELRPLVKENEDKVSQLDEKLKELTESLAAEDLVLAQADKRLLLLRDAATAKKDKLPEEPKPRDRGEVACKAKPLKGILRKPKPLRSILRKRDPGPTQESRGPFGGLATPQKPKPETLPIQEVVSPGLVEIFKDLPAAAPLPATVVPPPTVASPAPVAVSPPAIVVSPPTIAPPAPVAVSASAIVVSPATVAPPTPVAVSPVPSITPPATVVSPPTVASPAPVAVSPPTIVVSPPTIAPLAPVAISPVPAVVPPTLNVSPAPVSSPVPASPFDPESHTGPLTPEAEAFQRFISRQEEANRIQDVRNSMKLPKDPIFVCLEAPVEHTDQTDWMEVDSEYDMPMSSPPPSETDRMEVEHPDRMEVDQDWREEEQYWTEEEQDRMEEDQHRMDVDPKDDPTMSSPPPAKNNPIPSHMEPTSARNGLIPFHMAPALHSTIPSHVAPTQARNGLIPFEMAPALHGTVSNMTPTSANNGLITLEMAPALQRTVSHTTPTPANNGLITLEMAPALQRTVSYTTPTPARNGLIPFEMAPALHRAVSTHTTPTSANNGLITLEMAPALHRTVSHTTPTSVNNGLIALEMAPALQRTVSHTTPTPAMNGPIPFQMLPMSPMVGPIPDEIEPISTPVSLPTEMDWEPEEVQEPPLSTSWGSNPPSELNPCNDLEYTTRLPALADEELVAGMTAVGIEYPYKDPTGEPYEDLYEDPDKVRDVAMEDSPAPPQAAHEGRVDADMSNMYDDYEAFVADAEVEFAKRDEEEASEPVAPPRGEKPVEEGSEPPASPLSLPPPSPATPIADILATLAEGDYEVATPPGSVPHSGEAVEVGTDENVVPAPEPAPAPTFEFGLDLGPSAPSLHFPSPFIADMDAAASPATLPALPPPVPPVTLPAVLPAALAAALSSSPPAAPPRAIPSSSEKLAVSALQQATEILMKMGPPTPVGPDEYPVELPLRMFTAHTKQPVWVEYTGQQVVESFCGEVVLRAAAYLDTIMEARPVLQWVEEARTLARSELRPGGKKLSHTEACNYIDFTLHKALRSDLLKLPDSAPINQRGALNHLRGKLTETQFAVVAPTLSLDMNDGLLHEPEAA